MFCFSDSPLLVLFFYFVFSKKRVVPMAAIRSRYTIRIVRSNWKYMFVKESLMRFITAESLCCCHAA
jgi:hypothetical protein